MRAIPRWMPRRGLIRIGGRRSGVYSFVPNQVVSKPGDDEGERRAFWFLVHMEGLDDRPMTVRKYDSPAVRQREPFASALRDLEFASACCDALLTQRIASINGVPEIQRALWDACLVAVFKHYGKGAHPDVRSAITDAVSRRRTRDREAWDELLKERNRRIAHPVGVREGHSIGVSVDAEGEPFGIMDVGLMALRPVDEGVRWVRKLIKVIRKPLAETEERFFRAIADEVNGLTNDELLQLPSLDGDQIAIERAPGTMHGLTDVAGKDSG